jgi:hypothetical protein
MPRNAFYAQSGGVTAVINASAAGVIETARKHRKQIGKVYAGRNGILGALTEELIDTSKESAANIRALRNTPGGAFGSARYKLKGVEKGGHEYERLIEVFRAHDIGYFFYNGGNDSADTCLKVSQISETMGYPIVAVHVPKTVDNDLPITDTCPGFGSVAKYVATVDDGSGAGRGVDGEDLHEGLHPGSDGTPRGLDHRRDGARRAEGGPGAAHPALPRGALERGSVPRARGAEREAVRLLRRRRLGRPAGRQRQVPLRIGTQGRVRPLAAGRRRPDARQPRAIEAEAQAALGRSPTTCSAPARHIASKPTSSSRTRSARPPSSSPQKA